MNRTLDFIVLFLASGGIALAGFSPASQSAYAQTAGLIAIEGNVYDAKTGRPLPNVAVSLQGSAGYAVFAALTDVSGFFAMTAFPQQQDQSYELKAVCNTRKGSAETTQFMYSPLRSEQVYSRRIYLALPRGQSGCR